jgi:hypothetical protein
MIPASERAQAKAIKLNRFTPEQIKSFHQKMLFSSSPDDI